MGQFNYSELEKIFQDSIINIHLVINYIKLNNPKKYKKHYYQHIKIIKNDEEISQLNPTSVVEKKKTIKNFSSNKAVTNLLKKQEQSLRSSSKEQPLSKDIIPKNNNDNKEFTNHQKNMKNHVQDIKKSIQMESNKNEKNMKNQVKDVKKIIQKKNIIQSKKIK